MDTIVEIFTELIFQRIIVGIFGHYTLFIFYKLSGNEQGLAWLEAKELDIGDEYGRGCLIRLVGLISSCLFLLLFFLLGGLLL
jgi:hypothetical protein